MPDPLYKVRAASASTLQSTTSQLSTDDLRASKNAFQSGQVGFSQPQVGLLSGSIGRSTIGNPKTKARVTPQDAPRATPQAATPVVLPKAPIITQRERGGNGGPGENTSSPDRSSPNRSSPSGTPSNGASRSGMNGPGTRGGLSTEGGLGPDGRPR